MTSAGRRGSLDSSASIVISGPAARTAAVYADSDVTECLSKFELYDAACAIIYCPQHFRFAFRKLGPGKRLWFPTAVVSKIDGFEASIRHKVKQLLSHPDSESGFIPFSPLECEHYARIQCPVVNQYVTRVFFRTTLTSDTLCCERAFSFVWLTAEEIATCISSEFWGPEPLVLVPRSKQQQQYLDPFMSQPFAELTVDMGLYLRQDAANECRSVGYEAEDILRIYGDFVQHVFPSTALTHVSLITYLMRCGMIANEKKIPPRIEKAFFSDGPNARDIDKNLPIDFSRLLTGLALIDSDRKDIKTQGLRSFIGCAANKDRMAYPAIDESFLEISSISRSQDPKCAVCNGPNPMVCNFSVSLFSDGHIEEFVEQKLEDNSPMPIFEKDLQYNLRNERWFANQMIQWINDHAFLNQAFYGRMEPPHVHRRKGPKPQLLWDLDRQELMIMISQLCQLVKDLLVRESRPVVESTGPCLVIGSLHGSLKDLTRLHHLFWRRTIPFEVGRYVFLGNVTGVGGFSLECLLYLFALKCSAPSKVTLLRGKAENQSNIGHLMQELNEWLPEEATDIAESICSVFELMPIACHINSFELCITGRLPLSISSLEEMNHIPVHLKDTSNNPVTKEAVEPMSAEGFTAELLSQMKALSINTLITGAMDLSQGGYNSPSAVYNLSAKTISSVVLVTDSNVRRISVTNNSLTAVSNSH